MSAPLCKYKGRWVTRKERNKLAKRANQEVYRQFLASFRSAGVKL